MDIVYRASRYGKGGADYLNRPMDEAAYNAFVRRHDGGKKKFSRKNLEKLPILKAVIPIEVMAERGGRPCSSGRSSR